MYVGPSQYQHLYIMSSTPNNIIFQVSDALIKLQKTPEGSTARAGYLADLGKPQTYATYPSKD